MIDQTKSKEYSAAAKIDNSKLRMDIKKELMKRYKNGDLTLAILDIIRKATIEKSFNKIPSSLVKDCINEIIDTYFEQKLFYVEIIKKYIPRRYMKLYRAPIHDFIKMHSKYQGAYSKSQYNIEVLSSLEREVLVKYHWFFILNINPSLKSLTPSVFKNTLRNGEDKERQGR